MLQIQLDRMDYSKNDTVDFIFDFYKDSVLASIPIDKSADKICLGAQYEKSSKKIIAMIGTSDLPYNIISAFPPESTSRSYFPLQPNVIKYIKANDKKLNPWFRTEAVKRGVFKE